MKMNRLLNELKKNNDLYCSLIQIETAAAEIMSEKNVNCGSDHGIGHSRRIVETIEALYENYFINYKKLNVYEIFVLLAAAYLHDIGFWYKDGTGCSGHERIEYFRKNHPQISANWIRDDLLGEKEIPAIYFGDKFLAPLVGKVIISHGMDFWTDNDYRDSIDVNGFEVREKYLCYLLCLADALDYDKRRVEDIKDFNEFRVEDRVFIKAHTYVSRIFIHNNQITIVLQKPVVKQENEIMFSFFYEREVFHYIETMINVGKLIFKDMRPFLELNIEIEKNGEVQEPLDEEYRFILEKYHDVL